MDTEESPLAKRLGLDLGGWASEGLREAVGRPTAGLRLCTAMICGVRTSVC